MSDLKLPDVIDLKYWQKSVTPALDKATVTKVGDSIAKVSGDFEKVNLKLLDLKGVEKSEIAKRRGDIEAGVVKPLKAMLSGVLSKLESEAKQATEAAKKANKESAVKAILTAAKIFRSDVESTLIETRDALDQLEKGAIKNPDAAKDAGGAKDAGELKKKVLTHNSRVKKSVREVRSGKISSYPFVFAQNKVKEPYKKGRDWGQKSLAHVGPKAIRSFKTQIAKLIGTDAFMFYFGEVTCKDGKKLVFNFETPLANPKQLKDALLYQCGFAPTLQLRKGAEVLDEAGDGEDSGEPIGDIPDDEEDTAVATAAPTAAKGADDKAADGKATDDASDAATENARKDLKARFAKRSAAIQAAVGGSDERSKRIKTRAVALGQAIGNSGKLEEAKKLMQELEDLLDRKEVKKNDDEKAISDEPQPGVSADLVERIRKASQTWAASSAQAEKGIDQVMLALNKMFNGDERQGPKVKDALRTLNNLKPKLKSDLGAKLEQATKEPNESRRASLIKEAAAAAAAVEKRIADDPLMGELDGANNDVLPGVNIIGPMKSAIGAIRALV